MIESLSTYLIGLFGGISVGIQSPITAMMGARVGSLAGSFILHSGGALISLILLIARGGEKIADWRALPLYMLGSGVFGMVLILTLSYTIPRLGASAGVTLMMVGQLITSMIIDHFGWLGTVARPIDLTRLAGAGFLLLGGYLMTR
jgi:transporter family-2 protein